jgi:hypothetical protein
LPKMIASNENFKIRDGFESINSDLWDVQTDPGDLVELAGNTQGSGYLKISKSLDQDDTDTILLSKFVVDSPVRLALGMSMSQRLAGQHCSFGLVGVDAEGRVEREMPKAEPIQMASITQATTTLTVVTTLPHGYVPNDRIEIYDCLDSRANYGELLVATVVSPTSFTVTASPFGTIPSVTINVVNNSGFVRRVDPLMGANNGLAVFWEGTSASNAKVISRSQKSSLYNSADQSFGTNHTNATQANTQAFADAWNPSHMYDIRYKAEAVLIRTLPLDSLGGTGGVLKRSQVVPEVGSGYKIRIKASNNRAMTRPIAKITNIAKSGTTTATVTTDVPHGLNVLDYIQIYGVRDQTNFANLSTATVVASIVNPTTFTVVLGSAVTATSKGGVVIRVNGGKTIAPIAQTIQNIVVSGGQMTLTGSGTWAGLSPGETAEVRGVVDNSTGAVYTNLEGAFKVLSLSTTTLILATPNIPDTASVTVGGAVFKRTDLRLHLFRALDYTRHTVEVDGSVGNYTDYQEAMPVNAVNFSTSNTISNGQAAHDAAVTGNPVRIGGKAVNAMPAAVSATGDTADLIATMGGALIQKDFAIPEADWQVAPAAVTVTTDVVLKAAAAAGVRNYVTAIQMMNGSLVATEVVIKDGATTIWRGFLPDQMKTPIAINFTTPLRGTAATAVNFQCLTASSVYVSAQGFIAP